jgi:hypothetical protein
LVNVLPQTNEPSVCWSLQECIFIHSVDPEDGSPKVIEALKGIETRMDSKRFYAPDSGYRKVSVIASNSHEVLTHPQT